MENPVLDGWAVPSGLPEQPGDGPGLSAGGVLRYVARRTFTCNGQGEGQELSRAVAEAIRHLAANHANPVTVDDLARQAGLSKFYFTRKFHHETGMTPGAFVRRLRITRAMELLVGTSSDIHHIASAVGYGNHAAFTRAFGRVVGTTPNLYRLTRR